MVILRIRMSAKPSENLLGTWHTGYCENSFRVYVKVIPRARVALFPPVS